MRSECPVSTDEKTAAQKDYSSCSKIKGLSWGRTRMWPRAGSWRPRHFFITPPQLQNLNPLKVSAVEMLKSLMADQTCGIKEKLKKRMTQKKSQSTIIFWLLDPKSATSSDLQSLLHPKGTDSYFLCVDPFCKATVIFRRIQRFQPYFMYLLGTRGI